jgi:Protein of unknown function (DUF2652)/Polyketide cyclase / dehydrase and lipid transport
VPDQPEPACLVLADISGYTSYLAGVELDHAHDILADLTDAVVRALRPTFRLAKLEGDAAFAYVVTDAIDGSALQDTIERCYVAFRRRLRDIGQASQCDCNACTYLPRLDLKFVVHHGLIARQRMAGREELVGRDVIVVHRLLKNDVQAALGLTAYALYTDQCVRVMGLADPAAAGLIEHRETYDVVGEVAGWVRDLDAVWQQAEASSTSIVAAADAAWTASITFDGPPAVAWEWVTSPARRVQWQTGVVAVEEDVAGGRRGVGTTNHCVHGRDAIVEEILAWRPGEVLTTRFKMPGFPKFTRSEFFEATPDGAQTVCTVRVLRPSSAKDRARLHEVGPMLSEVYGEGMSTLKALISADAAARAAAAAGEPELPKSAGRNLSAPVTA